VCWLACGGEEGVGEVVGLLAGFVVEYSMYDGLNTWSLLNTWLMHWVRKSLFSDVGFPSLLISAVKLKRRRWLPRLEKSMF
jgi:hypothetical protein